MRNLLRDKVSVIHEDGRIHENVRASVQKDNIFIDDVTIPIQVGDRIERKLRNGRIEALHVTDFHQWSGGISGPNYYQISYRLEGVQRSPVHQSEVSVRVSDSSQTRVNIHSVDQSFTVNSVQDVRVFEEARALISVSEINAADSELLLEHIDAMEQGHEKGDFKQAYKEFMAIAANHIAVLGPVMPALASLL